MISYSMKIRTQKKVLEYNAAGEILRSKVLLKSLDKATIEDYDLMLALIDVHNKLGEYQEALELSKKALDHQPMNADIQSQTVQAYERCGDFTMAQDVKKKLSNHAECTKCDILWKSLNSSKINKQEPLTKEEASNSYNGFLKTSKLRTQVYSPQFTDWEIQSSKTQFNSASLDSLRHNKTNILNDFLNAKYAIKDTLLPAEKISHFKQNLLIHKKAWTICPFSGDHLSSDRGFYVSLKGIPFFLYYFESIEPFYLIIDDVHGDAFALFFPETDIIIMLVALRKEWFLEALIHTFKSWVVNNYVDVFEYMHSDREKLLALVGANLDQLGHALYNEVDALQEIFEHDMHRNIDSYQLGLYDFWHLAELFPKIDDKPVQYHKTQKSIFSSLVRENQLPVRPTHRQLFCSERLAKNVITTMRKMLPSKVINKIKKTQSNSPLLWIEVRARDRRVWLEQIEGSIQIINNLAQNFPKLGIVFAGWTKNHEKDPVADKNIKAENIIVDDILLGLNEDINTYRVIGVTMKEKLNWCVECDAYIMGYGTGSAFNIAIGRQPGVLHSNTYYAHAGDLLESYCEKAPRTVQIPKDLITNEDGKHKEAMHTPTNMSLLNYSLDWREIYTRINLILKEHCKN